MLLEMGEWMKLNSEAIYDTRPWKDYAEGSTKVQEGYLNEKVNPDHTAEDIRFTTKDEYLYTFVLDWPNKATKIKALGKHNAKNIKSIKLLGSEESINWQQNDNYLTISSPKNQISNYDFVFKVAF